MKSSTNMFSQILNIMPRIAFMRLVQRTGAERHAKGFSSWDQYVAMLFCQLAQSKSLQEITDGLAVTCGKLNHLGLRTAPAKSTLAYANAHRPWQFYQQVFFYLREFCRAESPGKRKQFRFKNKLLSIDSTIVELCLGLFPWAQQCPTKGAIKLHLLLDHDGYFPEFAVITDGRGADVTTARQFALPAGSIIALDRGYYDFALFSEWNEQGVFFVTRAKRNFVYDVVERRSVPQHSNVRADEIIHLTEYRTRHKYRGRLRRVVVWDEANQKETELLTNHLGFGATTIALIYRDRWQIEMFFKVLKQHLKIKTFVGTTPNALKTQIWTALIAMLLIRYLQFRSRCDLALCRLLALLRVSLFTYVNLWDWLNNPFQSPPEEPNQQLQLAF